VTRRPRILFYWVSRPLFSRLKLLIRPQTQRAASSAPSIAPVLATIVPTVKLSKFDWDLRRIGDTVVEFSSPTSTKEVTLTYNISNRDYRVSVFEYDCVTQVPKSVIEASSEAVIATPTHSNLTVYLDLKVESIDKSRVWSSLSDTHALLACCVRVDLVLPSSDGSSLDYVSFMEQKLNVSLDLQRGFANRFDGDMKASVNDVATGNSAESEPAPTASPTLGSIKSKAPFLRKPGSTESERTTSGMTVMLIGTISTACFVLLFCICGLVYFPPSKRCKTTNAGNTVSGSIETDSQESAC
jgi:hypothetical protein